MVRRRNRSGFHGIKIHVVDDLPEEDVTTIDGIPVTKPARTLLDLAATEPAELVERALDDALRRKLVSLAFLDRWLDDPRRRRHRGRRALRRMVDARATVGVTESPAESEFLKLLRGTVLPMPMLQYVVFDGGRFVGRLDFAYPNQLVAIEVDGFRYHADRRTIDGERARGNHLEAMGWRVLRVTTKHLEEDPGAVLGWVSRALGIPHGPEDG